MDAKEFRRKLKSGKINIDGGNRRVSGATKVIVEGVRYDSKLEAYFAGLLKQFKIPHEIKRKYILVEGFYFQGKKIRDITWTPDFYIPALNMIIDTKGHHTDVFKLKLKLMKKMMTDQSLQLDFRFPKTKKQAMQTILELKSLLQHGNTT